MCIQTPHLPGCIYSWFSFVFVGFFLLFLSCLFEIGFHHAVQAGLELILYPGWPRTHGNSPASAFRVLELHVCPTVPGYSWFSAIAISWNYSEPGSEWWNWWLFWTLFFKPHACTLLSCLQNHSQNPSSVFPNFIEGVSAPCENLYEKIKSWFSLGSLWAMWVAIWSRRYSHLATPLHTEAVY